MRVPRVCAIILLVLTAPLQSYAEEPLTEYFRPWTFLSKAEKIDLVSLDGFAKAPSDRDFHGWRELGRTELKDKKTRTRVLKALTTWTHVKNEEEEYLCFAPRHAIHAENNIVTVDVLICFECRSYRIEIDFKKNIDQVTKQTEDTLDAVLTDAGIPLAPKSKDSK